MAYPMPGKHQMSPQKGGDALNQGLSLTPLRLTIIQYKGASLEFVGEMAINSPFSEEVRHEPEQFMLLRTPQLFQHEWLWYRKALH